MPQVHQLLERVVKQLPAAGFKPTLVFKKGSSYRLWAKGKHAGLLYFSRSGSNPVRYFNVPYAKGRYAVSKPSKRFDKQLQAMYRRWRRSIYVERRVAVSRQMQKIFAERLPLVPLFFGQRRSGFAAGLVGWDPTGGDTPWWNIERWYFK